MNPRHRAMDEFDFPSETAATVDSARSGSLIILPGERGRWNIDRLRPFGRSRFTTTREA